MTTKNWVQFSGYLLIGISLFLLATNIFDSSFSVFTSFMEAFFGAIGLLLLLKSDAVAQKFQELQLRPKIKISINEKSVLLNHLFSTSVKVSNLTENPVENIIIRFKLNRDGDYSKWVNCFSLAGKETQELFWIRFADTIQASYHDLSEENFYIYTLQDSHSLTSKISRNEYESFLQEAIANRNNNTTHLTQNFENYIVQGLKHQSLNSLLQGYTKYISSLIFP